MRHLKKSVTDKVTLFYCYFDSEHPRYTWVVVANNTMTIAKKYEVLVPTIHVGCSDYIRNGHHKRWVLVPTMYVGCS